MCDKDTEVLYKAEECILKSIRRKMNKHLNYLVLKCILVVTLFAVASLMFSQSHQQKSVCVFDMDNRSVQGVSLKVVSCNYPYEGFTNEKGCFEWEALKGDTCTNVMISLRSMLYLPIDTLVDFSNQNSVQLQLQPVMLDGAEAIGYRRIFTKNAEKVTFKLDTRGLLETTKASIALRRVPELICGADGSLTISGNQKSAKLFLDGIEITEDDLSKIAAKDIDRIEIRRLSLHDGGDINVILKKSSDHLLKGEVAASAGSDVFLFYPALAYRSSKVDFSSRLSYSNSRQKSSYEVNNDGQTTYSAENDGRVQQLSASSRINLLFSNQLMSSLSYSFFGYKVSSDVVQQMASVAEQTTRMKEMYHHHHVNSVTRYTLDEHQRFFLKMRYFNYQTENTTSLPATKSFGRMNEWTGDFSYESDSLSFLKIQHGITVGYRPILRYSILNTSQQPYTSDVQQLYLKDNLTFDDRWSLYLLLRGEWAGYKLESYSSKRDFSFLPSATLNFESKWGSFSSLYARRIERPSVDVLNPEVYYTNDFTRMQGNPNLASQTTDRYSLSFSKQMKNRYLSVLAAYSRVSNLIENVFSDDYRSSTFENVGKGEVYGFNVVYSQPMLSDMLNLNLNVGMEHSSFGLSSAWKNRSLSEGNKGWSFRSSMNLSYMLPKDWLLNLTAMYTNKTYSLNATTHLKPSIDLYLEKTMFGDRLELSLDYSDVLNMYRKQRVEYKFKHSAQVARHHLPPSRISLSLVYRFGKKFRNRQVGQTIENDDMTTK